MTMRTAIHPYAASLALLVTTACAGASPSTSVPAPAPTEAPAPTPAPARAPEASMFPTLAQSVDALLPELAALPAERRAALDRIADFVKSRHAAGTPSSLTFICTGNSRRSHLGQLWAAVAAAHFGVDGIATYSGGTEPSALNPRTIAALERAGFVVEPPPDAGDNPHYRIRFAEGRPPIEAFSKRYDDPVNPSADFVAVMTCSEADQDCPFVKGAALRISLPYEDPKVADGTPEEAARYDAR
jgi:arsenate reductase